ncbi:hypothetical protein AB2L27_01120 [Kineococcus sp. LSe6-4]|uniref:Uncharacterized protein n=1 Tax=Kineococcus halophytocola TaxID=3234027 RepID=A0ABV4GWA6_9ACTN
MTTPPTPPVPVWTLTAIETAVRASWGPDTCFASAEYLARGEGRPSRGQCGPTALVLHELLGGDLVVAGVEHEGRVEGVHYWNVTTGGVQIDLTRDQFTAGESLVDVRRVAVLRDRQGPGERPFQVLRGRVATALGSVPA